MVKSYVLPKLTYELSSLPQTVKRIEKNLCTNLYGKVNLKKYKRDIFYDDRLK